MRIWGFQGKIWGFHGEFGFTKGKFGVFYRNFGKFGVSMENLVLPREELGFSIEIFGKMVFPIENLGNLVLPQITWSFQ